MNGYQNLTIVLYLKGLILNAFDFSLFPVFPSKTLPQCVLLTEVWLQVLQGLQARHHSHAESWADFVIHFTSVVEWGHLQKPLLLIWGGASVITGVLDALSKLGYVLGCWLETACEGIMRCWLVKAELPWVHGALLCAWNHYWCLYFSVLEDGLSVTLWSWRNKEHWIVLQWRKQRDKYQHCGFHLVACLSADMCPKCSLGCIKERKILDITTSAFLHRLFQFYIL